MLLQSMLGGDTLHSDITILTPCVWAYRLKPPFSRVIAPRILGLLSLGVLRFGVMHIMGCVLNPFKYQVGVKRNQGLVDICHILILAASA